VAKGEDKRDATEEASRRYWRRNLLYVEVLLVLWFLVSLGAGVLFVDELDSIRIGGFRLGFWFAQQGSIYAFVAIIFVYVVLMNRLDRRFNVDDRERRRGR
jgi:putative solute:sodium symporter small subunit